MKLCPIEVQAALSRAGGRNLQSKPLWKFIWSADFVYLISNGTAYERFRVVVDDCWLLVRWEPAEFWGSEEEWEYNNREFPSGLMTAGPFPREGRYRVAIKLRKAFMDGDSLRFENPIPTREWVEQIFPLILAFDQLEPEEKSRVLQERERGEKAELIKSFANSRKLYKGAATPTLVKKKEEAIERWMAKNPKGYNGERSSV